MSNDDFIVDNLDDNPNKSWGFFCGKFYTIVGFSILIPNM